MHVDVIVMGMTGGYPCSNRSIVPVQNYNQPTQNWWKKFKSSAVRLQARPLEYALRRFLLSVLMKMKTQR